ncbi:MAG TPA: hypothetical protein VNG31_07960, partial [Candidatus Baltobacteraceae bacterium]|nr:hypothetical protein [Candidatus Baltobacteraceae bacterium]
TTYEPVRDLFVGVPTSSLPLRGLRRLHSAYVIRGLSRRAAESRLTLPSHAFKRTIVQPEPPEPAAVDGGLFQEAARVDAAPAAATTVDRRISEAVIVERPAFAGIEPARAAPRFSALDDDAPALPESPVVETYEDDRGPPIQLPP